MTALEAIRAQYRNLSEADQLAVMCDLIQGGDGNLNRSDAFIDALIPLDATFSEVFDLLDGIADPDGSYDADEADGRFWRDSIHARNMGFGE